MIDARQKSLRYVASLAVVLGVHAAVILLALHWPSSQAVELPPAALMIELAAVPVPTPPAPPPVIAAPQPQPVEAPPLPKLAEAVAPDIAVPVEKPKPQPKPLPRPRPPKPVPEKHPEPPQPPVEKQPEAPVQPTPPVVQQPVAPTSSPAAPPSTAVPTWKSDLAGFINKHMRFPDSATRGSLGSNTNVVSFVLDADGNLVSCKLVSSSGKEALDRASLDMLNRAKTFPKPPAELLRNGTIELTIPLNYDLTSGRR